MKNRYSLKQNKKPPDDTKPSNIGEIGAMMWQVYASYQQP